MKHELWRIFFLSVAGCGSGSNSETTLPSSSLPSLPLLPSSSSRVGAWPGALPGEGPDRTAKLLFRHHRRRCHRHHCCHRHGCCPSSPLLPLSSITDVAAVVVITVVTIVCRHRCWPVAFCHHRHHHRCRHCCWPVAFLLCFGSPPDLSATSTLLTPSPM